MELYEQLLMEIQDGLQAVRDEQSDFEQVSYIGFSPEEFVYHIPGRLVGQRLRNNSL